MRHLLDKPERLREKLKDKSILLFLDYDGTITPIVNRPEMAALSIETKGLLRRLSELKNLKIVIISGRSLEDLKRCVGIKDIIYVGNHGLEIEGPKIRFKSPVSPEFRTILDEIKERLVRALSSIGGIFVEDKALTLSLHYRLAKKKAESKIKSIFRLVTKPYLAKKSIHITGAKMAFEIRPPIRWDKGKVTLWLLARQRFIVKEEGLIPIYIGDDITDEDAFKALEGKGLTIFVGRPSSTSAKYYLNNTDEVSEFLKRLFAIVKGDICPN